VWLLYGFEVKRHSIAANCRSPETIKSQNLFFYAGLRMIKNSLFLKFFTCFLYFTSLTSVEITVVSLAAGREFQETVQLGVKNKKNYCAQHGYDFICGEETLDPTRTIAWSKILLILKTMESSQCKWIFWSDADSLIMNTGLRIEDLIDESYNLIINYDFNGLNTGHFLIRNCEWSRQFLKEVYTHEEFIDDPEWDQGAILATLQQNPQYLTVTKTVQQRLMNSFPDGHGFFLQSTYQPGDFILHFAGVRNHVLLKSYFEYYYPLATDQTSGLNYEHYLGIYDVIKPPKQSALHNWPTEMQKGQYIEQLAKHSEIQRVAQVGLSDAVLTEVLLKNCPNLKSFTAYLPYKSKRYFPLCRAARDYLSRKYRSIWKEASEKLELPPTSTAVDLIHIQTRSLEVLLQARNLADANTLVWISDYNIPRVQELVAIAVERGLLEITAVHTSKEEALRAWVEAHYKF